MKGSLSELRYRYKTDRNDRNGIDVQNALLRTNQVDETCEKTFFVVVCSHFSAAVEAGKQKPFQTK